MASISPTSAIDLDNLLIIQHEKTNPAIPIEYRTINVVNLKYTAKIIVTETKKKTHPAKWETLCFWGLWNTSCCAEYAMGIAAGMKNSENQVPDFKAYATARTVPSHKIMEVPNHSHRNLFDERHPNGIFFDNVWKNPKINRMILENPERNGHPEMNAAPRDVKPRNIRPTLRRAPIPWPILTWSAKTDALGLVSIQVITITGEEDSLNIEPKQIKSNEQDDW
jgi:hypothetical protein